MSRNAANLGKEHTPSHSETDQTAKLPEMCAFLLRSLSKSFSKPFSVLLALLKEGICYLVFEDVI